MRAQRLARLWRDGCLCRFLPSIQNVPDDRGQSSGLEHALHVPSAMLEGGVPEDPGTPCLLGAFSPEEDPPGPPFPPWAPKLSAPGLCPQAPPACGPPSRRPGSWLEGKRVPGPGGQRRGQQEPETIEELLSCPPPVTQSVLRRGHTGTRVSWERSGHRPGPWTQVTRAELRTLDRHTHQTHIPSHLPSRGVPEFTCPDSPRRTRIPSQRPRPSLNQAEGARGKGHRPFPVIKACGPAAGLQGARWPPLAVSGEGI